MKEVGNYHSIANHHIEIIRGRRKTTLRKEPWSRIVARRINAEISSNAIKGVWRLYNKETIFWANKSRSIGKQQRKRSNVEKTSREACRSLPLLYHNFVCFEIRPRFEVEGILQSTSTVKDDYLGPRRAVSCEAFLSDGRTFSEVAEP